MKFTRNIYIKYLFIIAGTLVFYTSNAQQSFLYTQYMFNGLVINPAYAGSSDALNITALGRKQWVNVDGAPTTAVLSAHSPIKNEKMGLGLMIANDRISIFNFSSINAIYSYRVLLSEKKRLSFGLQSGLTNYNIRYSQLTSKTSNDPSLNLADYNSLSPTFGAGLYYNTDRFYLGLSAPLLTANIFSPSQVVQQNIYFLNAGYVFNISNDLKFKPNGLIRFQSGSAQLDLNANFLFRDALWAGISYRAFNMLSFLLQLNVSEQFRIGYAYDSNIGALTSMNSGSHEIMLNYLFSFNKSKVVSPRYF